MVRGCATFLCIDFGFHFDIDIDTRSFPTGTIASTIRTPTPLATNPNTLAKNLSLRDPPFFHTSPLLNLALKPARSRSRAGEHSPSKFPVGSLLCSVHARTYAHHAPPAQKEPGDIVTGTQGEKGVYGV
ncbi:hypothetical protein H0H92_011679 [Tricholoma furcatifolium]|nr:hypothetical protein H0H92_011679 [Tricholoma furcatifolium]